jgi:nucleotide-binding universal stress UspA family protein
VSVIVGYLPSNRGRAALDLAIREARLRNTDLVVIHSIHGDRRRDDEDAIATDRDLAQLDKQLASEGVPYTVHNYVRGNEPCEDVVQAAKDFDAELVVIGLRKRTSAGKFFLGSNAHDIMMNAPCPVLTVRVEHAEEQAATRS